MKSNNIRYFIVFFLLILTLPGLVNARSEGELEAGMVNPGAHSIPDWFKVSFLDLHEDVDEATEEGKRVMVYFLQDGCPYCKKLFEDNFGQRKIAEKTRKYFDVVAINIWGDREVTIGDKTLTEKEFAAALKVQYTPTLMFFNEKKKVIYRANGYYPPEKFNTVLDYVGQKIESRETYQKYFERINPQPATGKLHTEVATVKSGNLKNALKKGNYLLVMFEQKKCAACDELHMEVLKRPESQEQLKRFNVAVLDMWSDKKITTPDGHNMKIREWANKLDVKYAPSLLYFNDKGEEVFRSDAYLRAFHTQSVMDYVASSAYKEQTNFQRYIDSRADRLREQGIEVNLMD